MQARKITVSSKKTSDRASASACRRTVRESARVAASLPREGAKAIKKTVARLKSTRN